MAQVEVRWTAPFDLDGRPPKGYFTFSPEIGGPGDRVPIINGRMRTILPSGSYTVEERIEGQQIRRYVLAVLAELAVPGIDLEGIEAPAPGTAVSLISRAEFLALDSEVDLVSARVAALSVGQLTDAQRAAIVEDVAASFDFPIDPVLLFENALA